MAMECAGEVELHPKLFEHVTVIGGIHHVTKPCRWLHTRRATLGKLKGA